MKLLPTCSLSEDRCHSSPHCGEDGFQNDRPWQQTLDHSRTYFFIAAAILIMLTGCSSISQAPARNQGDSSLSLSSMPIASAGVVAGGHSDYSRTAQVWSFHGQLGQTIKTDHYRIHTTSDDPQFREVLPAFLEVAHAAYENLLPLNPADDNKDLDQTGSSHPHRMMDVYFFSTRREWELFTEEMLDDRAARYLGIGRGGFSTRGTAIMYDLGLDDSLTIAAHEGWHQFGQIHFEESIPIWLDEGIAVVMEGFSIGAAGGISFNRWHNPGRWSQLADAMQHDRLKPLRELITIEPSYLLSRNPSEILDYYAQTWSFTLFLTDYDHGVYRKRLSLLLQDAQNGNLNGRVEATLENSRPRRRTMDINDDETFSTDVLRAYFNVDVNVLEQQYHSFLNSAMLANTNQ